MKLRTGICLFLSLSVVVGSSTHATVKISPQVAILPPPPPPLIIPERALSSTVQGLNHVIAHIETQVAQEKPEHKVKIADLLKIPEELLKAEKNLKTAKTPYWTDHPDVAAILNLASKFRQSPYFEHEIDQETKTDFNDLMNSLFEQARQATEEFETKKSLEAEQLSIPELEKKLSDSDLHRMHQRILKKTLDYKKALAAEAHLKPEPKIQPQDAGVTPCEIHPFEDIIQLKVDVDHVVFETLPCAGQINVREKILFLTKAIISDTTPRPIDGFPELEGPPYQKNIDLLRTYLGSKMAEHFKHSGLDKPICADPKSYEDSALLFQAAHRMGFSDFIPLQIDHLVNHVSENQEKWKRDSAKAGKPILDTLSPWPGQPIPQVLIKPDGKIVILLKNKLIGEGGFKGALKMLSINLNTKKLGHSAGETIFLTT